MKAKFVRRAQTLSPFGVGAIMDVEGESFVAVDIARWKGRGERIREPRLEEMLGVSEFRMGPAAPDNLWEIDNRSPGIPYYRFPQWLFCSRCRRMSRWSIGKEEGEPPVCGLCPGQRALTPMRFVMACPRGHLADIPWDRWAHSRSQQRCEHSEMEFHARPGGSGLGFLAVRCRRCEAERNLSGIASPDSLRQVGVRCTGRQPWQRHGDARECDAIPQVLQRGATNLTFASVESSIDIPPHSDWATYGNFVLQVTSMPDFQVLKSFGGDPDHPLFMQLVQKMANDLSMEIDEVRRIVDSEMQEDQRETAVSGSRYTERDELLREEYTAFLSPDTTGHARDRFIKRRVPFHDFVGGSFSGEGGEAVYRLGARLESLVQAIRLREVRALRGFSRLSPPSSEGGNESQGKFSRYGAGRLSPRLVPADLGQLDHGTSWLPAIEVFGEGIFLSLNDTAVQEWERQPVVVGRCRRLAERHSRSGIIQVNPTPRLIMLHTLAHILIRQLSFDCGYTLASLRERVYSAGPDGEDHMAGILIYTAAGDSEGTLGGLVRQGEADRFTSTMLTALQSAEWCSSDPLCRESGGQGIGALNLAACHACSLLPETGCTMANSLLDRLLLLGTTDHPELGFFSSVIEPMLSSSAPV